MVSSGVPRSDLSRQGGIGMTGRGLSIIGTTDGVTSGLAATASASRLTGRKQEQAPALHSWDTILGYDSAVYVLP
jgi:hypothetical protein